MHVLVVGATGVLGRAVVKRLLACGHSVSGTARTPEKLLGVDKLGAKAVRGDILDGEGMLRLVASLSPDAVINLATAIPLRLKITLADWELNDRIRAYGTAILIRACEEARVGLLIQESVGYVCTPQDARWIDENSSRSTHPFLRATVEMEDRVRAASVPGVLLRFAALMSADSWHTQQAAAALRRGMLPIIGTGASCLSMIHADDAANAVALALERRETAAGKTYNVVDNAPAPMSEVFAAAAALLGAPAPKTVPTLLAKIVAGSLTLDILTASYRMSNARICTELGFAPVYPTYRETWSQIARALGSRQIPLSNELN